MTKPLPSDTDFKDEIITKVEKHDNNRSYAIQFDGRLWLQITTSKIVPKKGMKARTYPKAVWGSRVRGLIIEDKVIFYKTKEEAEIEWEKERQAFVKKMDEEKNRDLIKFQEEMKTAKYKVETVDISGFGRGGGYEEGCQQLLTNGLVYLSKHPDFKWKYDDMRNRSPISVYGITIAENDDSKKLDKALEKEVYKITDYTGGMHTAVISHLMSIWKRGYIGWLEEHRKREADRVYEINDKARQQVADFPPHK